MEYNGAYKQPPHPRQRHRCDYHLEDILQSASDRRYPVWDAIKIWAKCVWSPVGYEAEQSENCPLTPPLTPAPNPNLLFPQTRTRENPKRGLEVVNSGNLPQKRDYLKIAIPSTSPGSLTSFTAVTRLMPYCTLIETFSYVRQTRSEGIMCNWSEMNVCLGEPPRPFSREQAHNKIILALTPQPSTHPPRTSWPNESATASPVTATTSPTTSRETGETPWVFQ